MTKLLPGALLVAILCLVVSAQAPEPPVMDTRLTIHTLLREDIFAGFLQKNVVRLARAERNLEVLLANRPADRPGLLAWQGSATLTRAVLASEEGRARDFAQHYARALDFFSDAMRLGPEDVGVFAVVGGTNVSLAARLPARERSAAWEQGYAAYQQLWKLQSAFADKLPLHHKGELLTGLAEAAQHSGRPQEAEVHLDRILTMMPDTPYTARARQWKDDPASRATTKLTCQTCHAPGTLVARLADVAK